MIGVADIINILGDVQCTGGIHDLCGGYHKCIGGGGGGEFSAWGILMH